MAEARNNGGAQVLVVEDEGIVRESMRSILQSQGYSVDTAGNGREALNYLRTHKRPRVILLDLMMPVMNGWEFRRQQKRDPELAGVAVVLCSGVEDVQAEADLIGADGHLQKPITVDELTGVVSRFAGPRPGQPGNVSVSSTPGPSGSAGEPGLR